MDSKREKGKGKREKGKGKKWQSNSVAVKEKIR